MLLLILSQFLALAISSPVATISSGGSVKQKPCIPMQALLHPQKKASAVSPEERKRIEEAADRFITRFRETLDFGVAFDEMSASNAIRVIRQRDFFRDINLNPQLVAKVDEATLRRLYKAFMNMYYLKSAYDLSVEPVEGLPKGGSQPPPAEIAAAMDTSKFRHLLNDEGSGSQTISSGAEIEEFTADLNKVASLYRKHLSRSTFDSPQYKAAVKRINEFRDVDFSVQHITPLRGVRAGIEAYVLERDMFIFVFVKEGRTYRPLMFYFE